LQGYSTDHERLDTFYTSYPFRVYLKSKPYRYVTKILVCVDVKISYTFSLAIQRVDLDLMYDISEIVSDSIIRGYVSISSLMMGANIIIKRLIAQTQCPGRSFKSCTLYTAS
jgi:hypothetical protein